MAQADRERALCLLRGADKRTRISGVSAPCGRTLEAHASAAEPEGRIHMGPDHKGGRPLAPEATHPSSLARRALRRHTPKVGARCLNWARRDLSGGRLVTGVPTAKIPRLSLSDWCHDDIQAFLPFRRYGLRCLSCRTHYNARMRRM